MKRTYILPILLILFAFSGENPDANEISQEKAVISENFQISSTKSDEVEEKLMDGDVIYVQYTADWCGPCQQLKAKVKTKEFQSWLKENTKGYYYIDIDKKDQKTIEWKQKLNITSVPTVGLFEKQGDEWRLVRYTKGNQSLSMLKAMIR